ncbi:MAG TPA: GNAT family N-acetyltransferase [Rickettsia endosymbiont of Bembidion lapponicum]|nr:GNAT family N-acetyltransferase [Rickettsia endosymbiont of Bembidion lapponicum]
MTIIKTYQFNDWNQIQSLNWYVTVNGNSIALKSPYNLHRCNLCWDIYPSMLNDIISFYHDKLFYLHNVYPIDSSYLWFEGKIFEMELTIHNLKQREQKNNNITINTKNICLWSKIFTSATNLRHKIFFLFIKEFAKLPHINFFILYSHNIPVATSMLNIYNDNAVISSVAVLNQFRDQGFGKTIILDTINYAYKLGVENIYIYSMEQFCDLYKSLGFNIIEMLYLYKKNVNANKRI